MRVKQSRERYNQRYNMSIVTDTLMGAAVASEEADKSAIAQQTQQTALSAPRSASDIEAVDAGLTQEEVLEAIREGRNSDRW